METAAVINEGELQTVRLPRGFRLPTPTVTVRHEGDAIVLEPMKSCVWPGKNFDTIRIDDTAFVRPVQGKLPPVKEL